MPKTIKPKLVILSVPKVAVQIAKAAMPKLLKAAKPVRTGGRYKGSGSSKYWWSEFPSFLCKYCKVGYHTAKERTRHQHSHETPYHCHDCDYTNVRQDHLSEHMLKKHSKSVEVVRGKRYVRMILFLLSQVLGVL